MGSEFLKSFLTHIYAQVNAMVPNVDLQKASSFFPDLVLVEKMIIDPPKEPLRTFQNAVVNRENMSKSKNNKFGDTVVADGSENEVVSGSEVVVGESSKSFKGEGDSRVVKAMKRRAVRAELISGKGKAKEISPQEC